MSQAEVVIQGLELPLSLRSFWHCTCEGARAGLLKSVTVISSVLEHAVSDTAHDNEERVCCSVSSSLVAKGSLLSESAVGDETSGTYVGASPTEGRLTTLKRVAPSSLQISIFI